MQCTVKWKMKSLQINNKNSYWLAALHQWLKGSNGQNSKTAAPITTGMCYNFYSKLIKNGVSKEESDRVSFYVREAHAFEQCFIHYDPSDSNERNTVLQ